MLRIRLSMGGVRKRPIYKIVIADSRYPRDGKFIEKIGSYNPLLPKEKKERIKIEAERVKYWMSKGAQPTMRVSRLLGELEIMPMPKPGNNPHKAIPKKERKKAKEETKDAPKAEAKKEEPKAEAKKDAPKAEAKKEEPKAEAKKIIRLIKMLRVKIFTLYPDLFPGPLDIGLYKKARENHIWSLDIINIRDYALDKHKTVDDKPYGGGSGMVMRPDVLSNAIDTNINFSKEKTIYLSPKGKVFNQKIAKKMSKEKNINIICGHFEGIDQRLLDAREIEEISLGDYVLSGGETASFVFLDSILRLLPNVLGNKRSLIEESFEKGLLEHPHYTKPEKWEQKRPPEVLLSGDHAKINDWRLSQSEDITRRQRPDLWKKYLEKKK